MVSEASFKNVDDLPLILRVEDVAAALNVSRVTAYNLANSSDFPALRIGKRITIPKDAFLRWIENNTRKKGMG